MTKTPIYTEGLEAFANFNNGMKRVLAVPQSVIKERISEEKRKSAAKQVRPGPKRKVKPSVSPGPAA